jgi:hypothetical protein
MLRSLLCSRSVEDVQEIRAWHGFSPSISGVYTLWSWVVQSKSKVTGMRKHTHMGVIIGIQFVAASDKTPRNVDYMKLVKETSIVIR